MRHVSFDGTRLQLDILLLEVWKGWCELQTSYAFQDEEISSDPCQCLPNGADDIRSGLCFSASDTNVPEPISCTILGLCSSTSPCFCRSTGCTIDANGIYGTLDVKLESNQLIGSIDSIASVVADVSDYFDLSNGPWNVTLTRSK